MEEPELSRHLPTRRSLLGRILDSVPACCIACGKTCSNQYSLCNDCESSLPAIKLSCRRCGIEYAENQLVDDCCGGCLGNPGEQAIDLCQGLFHYTTPVSDLLARFKFHGKFEIGHAFSCLLAQRMHAHYQQRDQKQKPQLLIPVPLHRSRLRQRGFNQALEVARVLSRACAIPVSASAVCRTRNTAAQTGLSSANERKKNVRAAFSVKQATDIESVTAVAIIDDVVTTMATADALAKTLKSHGIQRVDVWCIARAGVWK